VFLLFQPRMRSNCRHEPQVSCKLTSVLLTHPITSVVLTSPTIDAANPAMAMRPTKTSLSLVKPSSKPARLLLLLLLEVVGTFWLILGACRQHSRGERLVSKRVC
jgi:hypothetical protein